MYISPTLMLVTISTLCGIAAGLTLRSSTEANQTGPGFMLFGSASILQILLSALANVLIGALMFFGPSSFILHTSGLFQNCGSSAGQTWSISLLLGACIGKLCRWWFWRKNSGTG